MTALVPTLWILLWSIPALHRLHIMVWVWGDKFSSRVLMFKPSNKKFLASVLSLLKIKWVARVLAMAISPAAFLCTAFLMNILISRHLYRSISGANPIFLISNK